MNRVLLIVGLFLSTIAAQSQNLSGQWKGEFIDKSTKYMSWGGDKCEYVLDLEAKGNKVTGFSYTYFTQAGKRYYTICRLVGTFDSKSKSIEVKEVERTKTNVPSEIMNCFQLHTLSFFKSKDGEETLEGNWVPASNQEGNCGYGATILSRRSLAKAFPGLKNSTTPKAAKTFNDPRAKTSVSAPTSKPTPKPTAVVTPKPKPTAVPTKPSPAPNTAIAKMEKDSVKPLTNINGSANPESGAPKIIAPSTRFEKRTNTVLKTIEIQSESVVIDLYDNGEVDGDSISLFFNGKLVIARKKLTTQPLRLRIPQEELEAENELVMYAENLGIIPPNTALMVVTDGNKRYEVRITSDLQKSGTIRFLRKAQ